MDTSVTIGKDFFERRMQGEWLRVEAWGPNSIRVRATLEDEFKAYDWALEPRSESPNVTVEERDGEVVLSNGSLSVALGRPVYGSTDAPEAPLRFFESATGKVLLQERESRLVLPDPGHIVKAVEPSSYRVEARFLPDAQEKFYGLGHNQHGFLNQKGCVIELKQMNTQTVVPVMYSSKGYGFFWNNPAYGRVELANNGTFWVAEQSDQLDYFVIGGGSPPAVATNYARITGFPNMMPDWAMGFWQCKLRYRTQDELMEVAREHKRRGLPMDVIVVDFFHWAVMGAWDFDPECWPDPEGMIQELKEMGIETMVSIWPP